MPREDVVQILGPETDLNSGWELEFFNGYLEKGCYEISIRTISDSSVFSINPETKICT